jgi:hypothetical protein
MDFYVLLFSQLGNFGFEILYFKNSHMLPADLFGLDENFLQVGWCLQKFCLLTNAER